MKPVVAATLYASLTLTGVLCGCATPNYIAGTTVEESNVNQTLVDTCEDYRHAINERDPEKLLSLASPNYYEDSGTPKGEDDYGLEGLKQILFTRMATVRTMRYDIRYRNIEVRTVACPRAGMADKCNIAHVDIHYSASYQMATAMGDRWEHKDSDKRLVLENNGHRWLFTAGM